jgi:hypothetical protein
LLKVRSDKGVLTWSTAWNLPRCWNTSAWSLRSALEDGSCSSTSTAWELSERETEKALQPCVRSSPQDRNSESFPSCEATSGNSEVKPAKNQAEPERVGARNGAVMPELESPGTEMLPNQRICMFRPWLYGPADRIFN